MDRLKWLGVVVGLLFCSSITAQSLHVSACLFDVSSQLAVSFDVSSDVSAEAKASQYVSIDADPFDVSGSEEEILQPVQAPVKSVDQGSPPVHKSHVQNIQTPQKVIYYYTNSYSDSGGGRYGLFGFRREGGRGIFGIRGRVQDRLEARASGEVREGVFGVRGRVQARRSARQSRGGWFRGRGGC